MPSPVGHALGGVIVGLLTRANTVGPNFSRAKARRPVSTFGLLAMVACAPDVDFLWGRHSAETHSLGAIVIVGLIAFALSRGTNLRLVVAVALAWGSHIFLDWLGSDTTPPIGVMALWPFSNDYFFAYAYVFESITRRYWLPNFWTHNVWAVVTEATILGPIVAFLVWMRRVR